MKILHTADIHLRRHEDERWKTLQSLIEIGKKEGIALFIISGDLFNKDIDAESLRPKIREIFSDNNFKIILIPGNHDFDSYKDMYFGEDAIVLNNLNDTYDLGDARICGIPFRQAPEETVIDKLHLLADKLKDDKHNIILYHGELLDAFFPRSSYGDEGDLRYAPAKLSYFSSMNINYVLAGHFHSRFDVRSIEGGGYFVYPGSPISITRKELGPRKVNLFEVGGPPKEYQLDTPYFEEVTIELDPFKNKNPIDMVRESLERIPPQARVILLVKGYFNSEGSGISETELAEQIKKIASSRVVEDRLEFQDIRSILGDDLLKSFLDKLELTGYEEDKKKLLRNMVVKAMMGVQR